MGAGKPLTDFNAGAAAGFVVELNAEAGPEGLNAFLKLPGDAHHTLDQLVLGDVFQVEVDMDA